MVTAFQWAGIMTDDAAPIRTNRIGFDFTAFNDFFFETMIKGKNTMLNKRE